MTDETAARPEPVRTPRFGLSGKLLVLTILFVMIAEVLIYVPSVANFRVVWLKDRLATAYTAALVLDAAPNGVVSDALAKKILDSIGARAVAMKMGNSRRMLAVDDMPPTVADAYDMRNVYVFDAIVDAFTTMLNSQKRRDARGRPGADGRRIYRSRHGRAAVAQGDAALFGRYSVSFAGDLRASPRRWSIWRCITCSCGRCGASPPT